MSTSEHDNELQCLTFTPGVAGSGLMRYAAAMYFHKAGKLDLETLEFYRALSKDDNADPLRVAKAAGAGHDIEQLIEGGF
jgi:hypothetical protein